MPKIIKSAKGTFTTADITIDSSGRVVTAATGTAGGGVDVIKFFNDTGGATGNYTANPGANNASAFIRAGGGGGGGFGNPFNRPGAPGGDGGFGYFFAPVSGGTDYAYAVGTGGAGGTAFNDGQTGGASTVANVGTANGGQGGQRGQQNSPGAQGNKGTAPGAQVDFTSNANGPGRLLYGDDKGRLGEANQFPTTGQSGAPGFIILYDNSGS